MPNLLSRDEQCIRMLLEHLGKEHPHYVDVLTLQDRLRKYHEDVMTLGESENLRNVWAQIRKGLNLIALEATGQGFDELCDFLTTEPLRFFICYKRNADPDQELANYLHNFLTDRGYDAFIDNTLRTGASWLDEMDQRIKTSDFFIVLLSEASADSEMVQAEVRRAYQYRKQQGFPQTLPVRIAYEGLLPYSIDAFLDPLQYVVWQEKADTEHVAHDILAAIEDRLPAKKPIQPKPLGDKVIDTDGRIVTQTLPIPRPLAEFDPRLILGELEEPGGAVKLGDKFYIERVADARLQREIVRAGTTTTIRAARQTGKSSLLMRGIHYAAHKDVKIVYLDMQQVDEQHLKTPDIFLRHLAEFIVYKLRLDLQEVEKLWQGPLGSQDKLTFLLEDYVLSRIEAPIVLAMDEVDRLLKTELHNDFFGLLRSWHNNRARDDRWNKLNIVMVISTEPYLLIADVKQSPFNVGLRLYLEDFDEVQVGDLNQRHGSPVQEENLHHLKELLGGHPYLTRKALYVLVTEDLSWIDLERIATEDHGPFGDHLRRYHWLLRDEPDLKKALKEIIRSGHCIDEQLFFRLLRAGLAKGSGDRCACRCGLYERYFEGKL